MHLQALDKCKVALCMDNKVSFFMSVLFSLPIEWSQDIKTAGVTTKKLLINPDFFLSLSHPQRVFLLLHETYHVAFKHILRKENRIHSYWNMATDFWINMTLVDMGYELPPGGLHDTQYQDMSSEEIYNQLLEEGKDSKDYDSDLQEVSQEELEEAEAQIDEIIARAAEVAQQQGKWGSVPDSIKGYLEKKNSPKLPWRTILWNHLTASANEDYSWRLPNKILLNTCYMPSRISEGMGELVMVIDVSGSTGVALPEMVGELLAMQSQFQPEKITVLTFNTEIQDIYEFGQYDNIEGIEISRGGGTCFHCVADWLEIHQPAVCITFTDCEMNHDYSVPSGTEMFWIKYGNNNSWLPTIGTVIGYDSAK